jgi:nitroimidazol reductase NimA-like FMN-containing flavoprotein (pyridoxamine 5'-phosphate oxidase superfamily)
MTPDEMRQFLKRSKTIVLSTIDHHGYPHSVAMWYEMEGDDFVMTTYAKSQKAMNVALMAEAGETYESLKGVLVRGRAELITDVERCVGILLRVHEKMWGGALPPGADGVLREQARKRVLIKVTPERTSSWDHSKLGGVY